MELEVDVGHILALHRAEPGQALGIKERGPKKAEKALEIILDENNGVACANHPEIAGGMGYGDIKALQKKFSENPFVVELNAQIPNYFGKNQETMGFSQDNGMVAFGNSDLHPAPFQKEYKLGKLLHTTVPKKRIGKDSGFYQNLSDIVLNHPNEISVGGGTNSIFDILPWKAYYVLFCDIPQSIRERKSQQSKDF